MPLSRSHVNQAYPSMNIVIEAHNASALQDQPYKNLVILPSTSTSSPTSNSPLSSKIDLILTLGGDGTILHASSLFSHSPVPPVLSFSMGTLGFLLPWHIDSMKEALRDVLGGKVTLLLRMRLSLSTHEGDGSLVAAEGGKGGRPSCEVHLMNEVTLHRGSQPHMTTIDAYVDGEHLTRAIVSIAPACITQTRALLIISRRALAVRRPHHSLPDRLDSLFSLRRGQHCSSLRTISPPHAHLPTLPLLPSPCPTKRHDRPTTGKPSVAQPGRDYRGW